MTSFAAVGSAACRTASWVASCSPSGLDSLTGVGDLGAAILAALPEAARAQVQPFIPAIVDAIHAAFSIATANTFVLGIGASLVAAGLVLLLREVPVTATEGEQATEQQGGATPASA